MASPVSFSLLGVKELQAALDAIPKRATQTAVLRRAIIKAATPMRDAAKSYAPGNDLPSGIRIGTRIRNEVGSKEFRSVLKGGGTKAQAVSALRDARRAAKASGSVPAITVYMGPSEDAFYAKWVEFGTGPRVQKTTGRDTGSVTPDPFMRPAFDKEAQPTIERLKPMLWQEIQRAAARAAKKAAKNGN